MRRPRLCTHTHVFAAPQVILVEKAGREFFCGAQGEPGSIRKGAVLALPLLSGCLAWWIGFAVDWMASMGKGKAPSAASGSGTAWGSRNVEIFEKVEQVGEGTYG